MKNLRSYFYFFCAALFIGLCASVIAAPETAAPAKQEGRYLFLIETSQAMDANKAALRKSIRSIIESGLSGQMKYGDTIGLWTYNDKFNSDFPMVVWQSEQVQDVEGAVDFWMSKQKFVHRPDVSKALPLLQKIVKASQKLTIIWMTTGNDRLTGLPFDIEINELQKEFRDGFRKQHIPFVTLLAVRDGVLKDFTVNPGDAKLRLPEVIVKEAVAPVVVETNPAPAVVPAVQKPPLIIHVGPSPELVQQKLEAEKAAKEAELKAVTVVPPPQQPATNSAAVAQSQSITNVPVVVPEKPAVTMPVPVQSNAIVAPVAASAAVASTASAATNVVSNAPPTSVVAKPTVPEASAVVTSPQTKTLLFTTITAVSALIAVLIIFFVKKTNTPQGPSFISQSMTRERLNSGASTPSSNKPADPE
jgi:hypothetical protein